MLASVFERGGIRARRSREQCDDCHDDHDFHQREAGVFGLKFSKHDCVFLFIIS